MGDRKNEKYDELRDGRHMRQGQDRDTDRGQKKKVLSSKNDG